MAFWFWVQLAVALYSTVTVIKQKREFKKQQKKLKKQSGFQINRFGQDEPLHYVLGSRRVGATFVYRGTNDSDAFDNIPRERYAALLVWSIGKVKDVSDLKLNDRTAHDWGYLGSYWGGDIFRDLETDFGGQGVGDPFYYLNTTPGSPTTDYKAFVRGVDNNELIQVFRNGPNSFPDGWQEFKDTVPDDLTGMEFSNLTFSTFRIFLTEQNRKAYKGGEPQLSAVITGPDIITAGNLFGPGFGQTTNPIDQVFWYLQDTLIGKGIDASELDQLSFATEAEYAAELITTPEGDQPRFTSNYVIDTTQTHKEIISDLLFGCHAKLIDSPNGIKIKIDRPRSSVMHFDEGDLIEKIQSSINDVNDRFNEVIVRFADATEDFKESEVSFPDRTSALYAQWLAEDKNRELIDEIEVETITDHYEAKRFAEYLAYKSRNGVSVSISVGAKGLQLEETDVITLSSTARGWVAKPFIVEGITLNSNGVGLELSEYNAEMYSYESPDMRTATPQPQIKNPFAIVPPTGLAVVENGALLNVSWSFPGDVFTSGFRLVLKKDSVVIREVISRVTDYDFSNLGAGSYSVDVYAQNSTTQSSPTSASFTIANPAPVSNIVVTDDYIEWEHINPSSLKEFAVEITPISGESTIYTTEPMTGTQRLGVNGIKSGNYDVTITSIDLANRRSTPLVVTNAQIDGATKGAIIGEDLTGQFDSLGGNNDATNFFTANAIKASIVDVDSLLSVDAKITGTLEAGTNTGGYTTLVVNEGLRVNNVTGEATLSTDPTTGEMTYAGGFGNGVIDSIDYFSQPLKDLLINDIGSGGTGGIFEYSGLPYSLPTTTNPTPDLAVTVTNGNDKNVTLSVTIKDSKIDYSSSNQNWLKPTYQIIFKRGTTTISTQTVSGTAYSFQDPAEPTAVQWENGFDINKTATYVDDGHSITSGVSQAYNVVINRVSGESNAPKLTAYSLSQQVVGGGGSSGGNADYATTAGTADNALLFNGAADTAFVKSAANNTFSGDNTFSGNNTFTAIQNFSNGLQKGGVDVLAEGDLELGLNASTFPTFTVAADYAKPQGWSGMIRSTSVNLPISNHGYWHVLGRRDSGGGYAGTFTEYSTGRSWIGWSVTSAAPTWHELAQLDRVNNWSNSNDFTAGLQKSSVNVLNETESDAKYLGISAKAADSEKLDNLDSTQFLRSDEADTATGLMTFTSTVKITPAGDLIQDGAGNRILHNGGQVVLGNLSKITRINGSSVLMQDSTGGSYAVAATDKAQTFSASQNFTGGLQKNGTDVVSLGGLTVDSAATQALAAVSMEQFEANKAAGLYDDYNTAEGSIAAGYINALTTQTNFLIANGANIEKLKAGSIQLSGDGALTFLQVGADAAGSAATAEANAKNYAFPAASAGALASLNSIGSTEITAGAVTTPKIATNAVTANEIAANTITAGQIAANAITTSELNANAVTAAKIATGAITTTKLDAGAITADKIATDAVTADKIEVNALVGKTIYAQDIQGDANEFGEAALPSKSIPYNSYTKLFEFDIGVDNNLDREVTIESFLVTGGEHCTFKVTTHPYPASAGASEITSTTFYTSHAVGSKRATERVSITMSAGGVTHVCVQALRNINGASASTSSSNSAKVNTRVIKGSITINAIA